MIDDRIVFRLADGREFESRRFFPLSKGDRVVLESGLLWVFVERDNCWIEIGEAWEKKINIRLGGRSVRIVFKEIETKEELENFAALQIYHYRGGSGVGRAVPIIAKCKIWDLPPLLGFIEISSSMIANTARKRFFDFPYREEQEFIWKVWDRDTSRKYSNMICRISRFVIHPEIRGIGLAKEFIQAALSYASTRWHFGGYQPRFMEITADMLRYYHFLSEHFRYIGETQGNEHRLQKDMRYLVRKALADDGRNGMPQGGGGIMSMQRSYANKLLRFLNDNKKALPEVIDLLRYDACGLDQETWEALHKLYRRPKPVYMAGVSPVAQEYVHSRSKALSLKPTLNLPVSRVAKKEWRIKDLTVHVSAKLSQSNDARHLQDSFGFVGSELKATILQSTGFSIKSNEVTLVCGASGAGKTLLLDALLKLSSNPGYAHTVQSSSDLTTLCYSGSIDSPADVKPLTELPNSSTPVDLIGRVTLAEFLNVAACAGLAEPQLLARPIETLSAGQKYRLKIALSFLQKPEVLLIDNFCEHLDRFTLLAVCKGLKNLVKQYNVSLVVATSGYERVQGPLQPNQKVILNRGNCAFQKKKRSTHEI